MIAQLYTGDVGLKMERRSYQGSSGGFKRSARDLHHMTAPRKAAVDVELQLREFFSLTALHLHPPSLTHSLATIPGWLRVSSWSSVTFSSLTELP